ncbi:pre-mRNA 3-end-processing factor fip1l1 [Kappamyces sp. JEL0680]|nr:pre-mRNA 3-end-processing factor fip1l1 [Kappamyces sp. JEL0680]
MALMVDSAPAAATQNAAKAGLDIEIMGQYEGVDIVDVDLESFDDKPWRKPGADLTDYFNYGFNEQTWKAYCNKQKLFRDDLAQQRRLNASDGRGDINFEMKSNSDQKSDGKYLRGQEDSRRPLLGKRQRDDEDRDG